MQNISRSQGPRKQFSEFCLAKRIWTTRIISDFRTNITLNLLILLLSCFQILFLHIETYILSINLAKIQLESTSQEIVRFFTISRYIDLQNFPHLTKIILSLAFLYILILSGSMIIVLVQMRRMKPISSLLAGNFLNLTRVHNLVFMLPLHNIFLELIFAGLKGNIANWMFGVGLVGDILNLALSVVDCAIYLKFKSEDHLSRLNNFYIQNILLEKIIIQTLNSGRYHGAIPQSNLLGISILGVLFESMTKFTLLAAIPFCKFKYNLIATAFSSFTFTFSALSSVYNLLYPEGNWTWGFNYLFAGILFSTLVLRFEYRYLQDRRSDFNFFNQKNLVNKYWCIQQFYQFRKLLYKGFMVRPEERKFQMSLLLGPGVLRALGLESEEAVFFYNKAEILVACLDLIKKAHKKDPLVDLIVAHTLMKDQGTKIEASVISGRIFLVERSLSNQMTALKIQEELNKKLSESLEQADQRINLNSYFQHRINLREIIAYFNTQITLHSKIYTTLQEPSFILLDFMRLCYRFFKDWAIIDRNWHKYTQDYNKISSSTTLLYAFHNLFNRHDSSKYKEWLSKYQEQTQLRINLFKSSSFNSITIFDQKNVAIRVSTAKSNMGVIHEISSTSKTVLGISPSDLLHKNITQIMPQFFHNVHDKFILKKCEETSQGKDLSLITTFAVNGQGYLIPINILTCLYPQIEEGIMVYGLLRPRNLEQDYMIVSEDFEIENYTERIAQELNFGMKKKYKVALISKELHVALKTILNYTNKKKTVVLTKSKTSLESISIDNQYLLDRISVEGYGLPQLNNAERESIRFSKVNINISKFLKEGIVAPLTPIGYELKKEKPESISLYKITCFIKTYYGKTMIMLSIELQHNPTLQTKVKSNDSISENESESSYGSINEDHPQPKKDSSKSGSSGTSNNNKPDIKSPIKIQIDLNIQNLNETANVTEINIDKIMQKPFDFSPNLSPNQLQDAPLGKQKTLNDDSQISSDPQPDASKPIKRTKTLNHPKKVKPPNLDTLSRDQKTHKADEYDRISTPTLSDLRKSKISTDVVFKALKKYDFHGGPGIVYTFHMLTFYVCCLLITIFMIYYRTISGVSEIKTTLNTTFLIVCINNYFFRILEGNFLASLDFSVRKKGLYVNGTKLILKYADEILEENNQLSLFLDTINSNLKEDILQENIRVYFDNFDNLTSSSNYFTYNFFDATKVILTEASKFARRADPSQASTPWFKYSTSFLETNLYNDYFSRVSALVTKFQDLTGTQVSTLQMEAVYILLAFSSMSFFLHISASILFYYFTKNNIDCAQSLFGLNYENEVKAGLKALKAYQEAIESSNFDDLLKSRHPIAKSVKSNAKKPEDVTLQVTKPKKIRIASTSMILMAVKRYVIMSISLGVSFVVIIAAHVRFITSINTITKYYNDIIKASEISSQLKATTIQSLKMSVDPLFYSKYQPVETALQADIDILANKITNGYTHFTFDFQAILSESFCQYKTAEFDCLKFYKNGVANNGIFPTIYYLLNYFRNQITLIKSSVPGTLSYNELVLSSQIEDTLFLVFDGISPAFTINIKNRIKDLENRADEEISIMMIFAVVCFILALAAGILPRFFIKPYMMQERIGLAKSMFVLPLQVVLRNRAFKEFLLKDSKEFYHEISKNGNLF